MTSRRTLRRIGTLLAGLVLAGTTLAGTGPSDAAISTPTWVRQIGRPGAAGIYAWGAATARDGTILIGNYNQYNVKRYSTTGQLLQTISSKGTAPGQINQPYGLAVDPADGAFYVVDTIPRQIEKFAADGTHLATWDINPAGGYYTTRAAVNSQGVVYAVNSQSISQTSPHRVLMFDRNGTFLTRWGTNGSGPGQTYGFRGIDIDRADNVWIADGGNKRVQLYDKNGVFIRQFGSQGSGAGQFGYDLRGLALDEDNGWVYVSDASEGQVEKFDLDGTPLATLTIPGPEEGTVSAPREITVGLDHRLYVSDYASNQVAVFSTAGAIVQTIPAVPQPAPNGGLNQPEGVAVDNSTGQVYVADTFNHRIQRFSVTGTFQTAWGYRGRGTNDAMDYPRGIAVDQGTRNAWLNNTRSAQVKVYNPDKVLVRQFGTQGQADDQFFYARGIHVRGNRVYVPDSGNLRLKVMDHNGNLIWKAPCGTPALTGNYVLFGCTSVTTDGAGNVYAAAPTEDKIYKWNANGTLLATWGTNGTGDGQLDGAYGVAVRGNLLYVSEMDNNRISVFDLSGNFQGRFGSAGGGHGQFRRPTALTFDPQGRLYVTDTANGRIEVFSV